MESSFYLTWQHGTYPFSSCSVSSQHLLLSNDPEAASGLTKVMSAQDSLASKDRYNTHKFTQIPLISQAWCEIIYVFTHEL